MQYLVDFHHGTSDADISQYLADNGCTVLKEWDNFDKIFLVECSAEPPKTAIVERLVEELPMKVKPLNHVFHISGATDPYIGTHQNPNEPTITINTQDEKDWWKNYTYIQPKFDEETYTINRKGHNIKIYLMDSGIETSHPEFANARIDNLYTVVPGDFGDNTGHGTALASVMVGATCGISDALVKNVKIFDNNHQTLQSEFLDALDAVINDHVDGTFAILNCSWIIAKNEYIEHKLRIAFDEGIHILAAAGNQGGTIEDVTPACMPEALTVGAYNKDLLPCDFSNYTGAISTTPGAVNTGELDGWAPGDQIWAACLNGTYGYTGGTSIATAIATVVGAVNATPLATEDGTVIPPYDNGSLSTLDPQGASHIFVKRDLLDLSDPKYANCVNAIAGLSDRQGQMQRQSPDTIIARARVSTDSTWKIIGTVFVPMLTKNVEWVNPLPSAFFVNQLGKLCVKESELTPPAEGENYGTITSTFNRTNTDDTTELVTLTIYVLPENFDPGTLPEGDPVIDISLQNTYCFNGGGCYSVAFAVYCLDSCTWQGFCCSYCGALKIYFVCNCGQVCP